MKDWSNFLKKSRKWLEDYIITNHLKSLIIGISGGIDSTVSAAIACPVCKELNIPLIGRSLPCHTNNPDERHSADLVGKAFCNDFKEVNLNSEYLNLKRFLEYEENELTPLQLGNIKARLRMIYLRNLASIHKGVVIDNDNFTEWNLGFWTVGGDSPMDINLGLHYLWKTEIYELAHYLVEEYSIKGKTVLPSIESNAITESIKLTPTDGNGVMAGGDCAQFGLNNYIEVDDILKTMYYSKSESEQHFKEYVRLIDSYNEQGVDKVMMLYQNTEFKRKPTPICPSKTMLEYD